MCKQLILLCTIVAVLISCRFSSGKKNAIITLETTDTIINFNSVDAYPLFPSCKEIPSREKQKICFQLKMSEHIYNYLKDYRFTALKKINDTVFVQLKVDAKGKTTFFKSKKSEKVLINLPKLDSVIKASIAELPILQPAIKRDMPVTTKFTLPIIIKN